MGEGVLELEAASGDPGVVLAADFERGVLGEEVAGFRDAAVAGEDLAGEDEGLGAGAALGEAAVGEELIGSVASHGGFGTVRAGGCARLAGMRLGAHGVSRVSHVGGG